MEADTEVGEADGAEKATVVAAKWPAVEALEAEEVKEVDVEVLVQVVA